MDNQQPSYTVEAITSQYELIIRSQVLEIATLKQRILTLEDMIDQASIAMSEAESKVADNNKKATK